MPYFWCFQDFLEMKTELIAKLEELLTKDAGEVAADVRSLQREYQKQWTSEFEKARQSFIDEGGKAKEFEYPKQAEDEHFDRLMEQYARLKKESDQKEAAEQAKNLIVREEIIAKIKDLSQLSENVGAAIKKLQELQTQWKETGSVSPHKYKDVQAEYSKAIESFFYNLNIYRELQEHDLKKNYELKKAMIEKFKSIQQVENIKEAERLVKVYRNDWEDIGPVPNDKWESLKAEYRSAMDETYAKIKSYYNAVEEEREANAKLKKEIIGKAQSLLSFEKEATAAQWNERTEHILALQNEWKNTGRVSEKDNEKLWSEFRAVCDDFFSHKKVFFEGLNERFAANRKIKHDLIQKAEALQNSTDWQKTGLALIKLQEEWKKNPSGGDKEEPKLFQRFRKACNTFFDAKKAYYENLEAGYEGNLAAKEAILERLNTFVPGEDMNSNRDTLKQLASEFSAAGMVPMKDKKRVNDAFYNKLDELYEQMNLNRSEKLMMQFKSKIERFVASDNAYDLLRKEAEFLKKQMDEINGRIRTYDNNLGFFKSAKGKNDFMKEIEEKIDAEKTKLKDFEAKRKLVLEEQTKLREANTVK